MLGPYILTQITHTQNKNLELDEVHVFSPMHNTLEATPIETKSKEDKVMATQKSDWKKRARIPQFAISSWKS